jgi:hypothetical protein
MCHVVPTRDRAVPLRHGLTGTAVRCLGCFAVRPDLLYPDA